MLENRLAPREGNKKIFQVDETDLIKRLLITIKDADISMLDLK